MTEFHFDVGDSGPPPKQGGLIIGAEVAAMRMEAGVEVVPLRALLDAPDFPYCTGDFSPLEETKTWSRKQCLHYGEWILRVVGPAQRPSVSPPTRTHIDRLRILGLGPARDRITTHFNTFAGYRTALGVHQGKTMRAYDSWTPREFVEYASSLAAKVKGAPQRLEYQREFEKGSGPSPRIIEKYMGSVPALNDLIGYPNVEAWEDTDFLEWGMDVLAANSQKKITTVMIYALAKRQRGPSTTLIRRHFRKITSFQQAVVSYRKHLDEKRLQIEKQWADSYNWLCRNGTFTEEETDLSTAQKAIIAMRYRIAAICLPFAEQSILATIARQTALFSNIRGRDDTVKKGTIELAAERLGVFDIIWPPSNVKPSYLKVSDKELRKERERWNRSYQRNRAAAR